MLAEDYVLGQAFHRAGLPRGALRRTSCRSSSERRTVAQFLERHLRWSQMRRRLSPAYFGEPLLNPVPFLLAAAARPRPGDAGVGPWRRSAGIAVKIAADALLARRLRGEPLPLAPCSGSRSRTC